MAEYQAMQTKRTAKCRLAGLQVRRGSQTVPRRHRRGAALVEFAFAAPIFFLLLAATFQFEGVLMGQNLITAAARDAARIVALPDTTSTSAAVAAIHDRMAYGGIPSSAIAVTFNPSSLEGLETGDKISINVSCPIYALPCVYLDLSSSPNVTAQVSAFRE